MGDASQPLPTSLDRQQLAELTDRSLMRRLKAGEDDAATALYLRYAKRLQQLADSQVSPEMALRVDPEGVVQSVFRTFFRRAATGQYEVSEKEDLWKLLLVMALNKLRTSGSFHRAAKRDIGRTRALNEPTSQGDGEHEAALSVLKMTIDEVVGSLPAEHRPMIWLRIEGFEVAEIAAQTGRAKRSVERVLQGFRQTLSSLLEFDP